ncbi:sugar kinase [Parafrigoribacterium humi]|uniref:sugar kinase n=1 Tax=Parafrigoribacterium humi TaxID=3144664 RepID=UPI0032EB5957
MPVRDASSPSVDVLGIGETMIAVVPVIPGRVDADSAFVLRAAGAESNVVSYISELGHEGAWLGRVGNDFLGSILLDELARSGVDTSRVERDDSRPTGVFFKEAAADGSVVHYYRTGSAGSGLDRRMVEELRSNPPRVVHVSGITPALSESCRDVIDYLVHDRPLAGTVVSFDVNYRPQLWASPPYDELLRLARGADVVFVGLDEAEVLWGTHTAREVRSLMPEVGTLVVKDGARDAVSFTAIGEVSVAAPVVDVVEPVGAGDAFAAGWLSAKLRGFDHEARLRLGHLVAGAALASVSDHGPLPSEEHILATLGVTAEQWLVRPEPRLGA